MDETQRERFYQSRDKIRALVDFMNSKKPNAEAQDVAEILKPAVLAEINLKRREGSRYSRRVSQGTVAPSTKFGLATSQHRSKEGTARENDSPEGNNEDMNTKDIENLSPTLPINISIENLENDKAIEKNEMENTRTQLR